MNRILLVLVYHLLELPGLRVGVVASALGSQTHVVEVAEVHSETEAVLGNEVVLLLAIVGQALLLRRVPLVLVRQTQHVLVVVDIRVDQPVLHRRLVSG